VVVGGALSREEVAAAKDLIWQDLEEATPGLQRGDVATWRRWTLPPTGLNSRLAQGAGAWHVRGCEGVKRAFARVWGTSDLIVSMDCVIAWRPWWLERSWKPVTEGLHLDQNPFSKPGLECVQGMVPLVPVTSVTGGLQVVPASHTEKAKREQKRRFPHLRSTGDWCPLACKDMKAQLLLAEAGDLILWDSRTIHGGVVGSGQPPDSPPEECSTGRAELARLAVTVAMTPRAWASEEVLKARADGFQAGRNFNHSPHEAGTSAGTLRGGPRPGYKPIDLTPAQRALL